MRHITFRWRGAIISGIITSQRHLPILGQATDIKGDDGNSYTLYGKCQIGNCGPFTILSLSN